MPLTSSPEEMDAFTLVMFAVELERKRNAKHDALKSTNGNSDETTTPVVAPKSLCHHEGLRPDHPTPKIVS